MTPVEMYVLGCVILSTLYHIICVIPGVSLAIEYWKEYDPVISETQKVVKEHPWTVISISWALSCVLAPVVLFRVLTTRRSLLIRKVARRLVEM